MFIFIGGSSRSGTNTVSAFLHLHDDITTLRTMRKVTQHTETELRKRCEVVVFNDGYDCLTTCLIRKDLEYDPWTEYVQAKNKRILERKKFTKHLGIRWDYCEWSCEAAKKAVFKGEAKLVFAMRDLNKIFESLTFHGFGYGSDMESNRKSFESKIANSVKAMNKLKGCPVKVSRGEDYRKLMAWLGLEPNTLQEEWIKSPPVTNSFPGKQKKYSAHKEKMPPIKIDPALEKSYWALRQ
jgi:hypothetical protein